MVGTHTIGDRRAYQIPLAVFFAAPAIQSVAMFFFPETPRWLMVQGKEREAEVALRRRQRPFARAPVARGRVLVWSLGKAFQCAVAERSHEFLDGVEDLVVVYELRANIGAC